MLLLKYKWQTLAAILLLSFVAFRVHDQVKRTQQSARLMAATRVGDRIEVLSALEEGAPSNLKDSHQRTVLMLAAARGDIDVVRSLLDSGARVNGQDDRGMTALMWATLSANPSLVALLIFWKADLNARANDGATALKLAHILAADTPTPGEKWRLPPPTQRRQAALIVRMLEQAGARE